jgi:hypothetical protein
MILEPLLPDLRFSGRGGLDDETGKAARFLRPCW